MCGPVNALPPWSTQKVFLRWAPSASTCRPPARCAPAAGSIRARGGSSACAAVDHADDGVVVPRVDLAVVEEKTVGDVPEPPQRFVVVLGDRLLAHVAAGHDQRPRHRRAGAGDASAYTAASRRVPSIPGATEPATARRAGIRAGAGAGRSAARTPPAAPPPRRSTTQRLRTAAMLSAHHGKRLCRAGACADAAASTAASYVASQHSWKPPSPFSAMISPQAIDAAARLIGSPGNLGPAGVGVPETRSARRTCIRLRVKASVARVLILTPAGVAHRELTHRRQRPVVRDVLDDREPRTAVRAVGEGVAVAAIARIARMSLTHSGHVAASGAIG